MGDVKTDKTTEIVTKKTKDKFTITDILKNNTRFMIHGFLSIYNELNLNELSELSGKSKSSLVDHLSIMLQGGLIEISREERVRGKNTRKYYSLVADADEQTVSVGKTEEDHYSPENMAAKIETLISFSQIKISMLSKWIQYLEGLQKKVDLGQSDEIHDTFQEIWGNWENFSTVSYYSPENAQQFKKKCHTTYLELEEEAKKEQCGVSSDEKQCGNKRTQNRPFYATMTLLPIERVLNSLKKKKPKKKNLKG